MTNELIEITSKNQAGALTQAADAARSFIRQAKADNTRRAYRSDWQDFTTWCEGHGLVAFPAAPDTVVLYLSDAASGLRTATLTRRISAISQAHQMAGYASP